MELVEGQTLKHRIEGKPLAIDRCWLLVVEIADALEAAHAKGIVHRDIKPGRICILRDDWIVSENSPRSVALPR